MKLTITILALIGVATLTASCNKGGQNQSDEQASEAHNQPSAPASNLRPPFPLDSSKLQQTASGLRYQIIEQGTGEVPKPGEFVVAHYHGTLMDGTKFDSSFDRGQPFEFQLGQGQVIRAWDEAFSMLPVGTSAIIIAPATLAYGDRAMGDVIQPGSTLRFDVQVLGANQASTSPRPGM